MIRLLKLRLIYEGFMNIQIFLRIQHGLFLWRVLIFFGNKKLARGNRRL